jgi:hypothetical protein
MNALTDVHMFRLDTEETKNVLSISQGEGRHQNLSTEKQWLEHCDCPYLFKK